MTTHDHTSVFGEHATVSGDVAIDGDAVGRDKIVYIVHAADHEPLTLRTRAQRELARRRKAAALAASNEARVLRLSIRHLQILIAVATASTDPLLSEAGQALAAELETIAGSP